MGSVSRLCNWFAQPATDGHQHTRCPNFCPCRKANDAVGFANSLPSGVSWSVGCLQCVNGRSRWQVSTDTHDTASRKQLQWRHGPEKNIYIYINWCHLRSKGSLGIKLELPHIEKEVFKLTWHNAQACCCSFPGPHPANESCCSGQNQNCPLTLRCWPNIYRPSSSNGSAPGIVLHTEELQQKDLCRWITVVFFCLVKATFTILCHLLFTQSFLPF